MSAPSFSPTFLQRLYNHNPFYALSAVLVLYSVQAAHASVPIGEINVSLLTGVLVAYTLVLAGLGVLIVRFGQVWEDARSIFVLLLLLLLAVSIGADELFVTDATSGTALALLAAGYVFSAGLIEAVLRLTGVRLGGGYRVPLHLLLALFYVAPWWCSPELHQRSYRALEWTLLMFPAAAAGLLLLLIPVAHRGRAYVAGNGTPWSWPWFPWTAFGVLIAAVGLRSFVLAMAFGPHGPMWIELKSGARLISFDTIWGPYFLVAPAFATLLLIFEAGVASRNERLTARCLQWAPSLLLLALPYSHGPVFRSFLREVTNQIGSPLWLTVWLLLGFYGAALVRGARSAVWGMASLLLALSVVGQRSTGLGALQPPSAWPLWLVGGTCLIAGIRRRSSALSAAGLLFVTCGLWQTLPSTPLGGFRATICYHVAAIGVIVLSLMIRDQWTDLLQRIGAVQFPLASMLAFVATEGAAVPSVVRIAYVIGLTVAFGWLVAWSRSRWYAYAFAGQLAAGMYAVLAIGFRQAVLVVGRGALTAFLWSLGMLGIAGLISAHKARWLPAWFQLPARPIRPPQRRMNHRSTPRADDQPTGSGPPKTPT